MTTRWHDLNEAKQREALRATDPSAPGRAPVADPATLEDLMAQIIESSDQTAPIDDPGGPPTGWSTRTRRALAVAAATVVLGGGGAILLNQRQPTAPPAAIPSPPSITLAVEAADATAMCLAIDVATTRQAELAFSGTVTSLTNSAATLSVDRWFKGGSGATAVTVQAPTGEQTALVGLPQLEVGTRYLIVASGTTIDACGASGVWTPELQAHFEAAFPG